MISSTFANLIALGDAHLAGTLLYRSVHARRTRRLYGHTHGPWLLYETQFLVVSDSISHAHYGIAVHNRKSPAARVQCQFTRMIPILQPRLGSPEPVLKVGITIIDVALDHASIDMLRAQRFHISCAKQSHARLRLSLQDCKLWLASDMRGGRSF